MHLISKRSFAAKPRFLFGDARNCTVKWKGGEDGDGQSWKNLATLQLCFCRRPPSPLTSLTMGRRRAARRRRRTLSRNIHRVKMRPTKQLCSDLNARNEKKHLYSSSTHAKKPRSIYNLSILPSVRQGEEDLPPLPSLASLVYPKGRRGRRGVSVESGSHLFSLSSSFLFLWRELFLEREASRPRPAEEEEECLRHPGGGRGHHASHHKFKVTLRGLRRRRRRRKGPLIRRRIRWDTTIFGGRREKTRE